MTETKNLIGLDSSLDKLRNKELTSGCMVNDDSNTKVLTYMDTEGYYNWFMLIRRNGNYITGQSGCIYPEDIIGHPLTWGRICYIFSENLGGKALAVDTIDSMTDIFEESPKLFEQNELQRMQHEKRPELKALLIQFSDYL